MEQHGNMQRAAKCPHPFVSAFHEKGVAGSVRFPYKVKTLLLPVGSPAGFDPSGTGKERMGNGQICCRGHYPDL